MHPDFELYNPIRRPDWRYERVLRLVDRISAPGRCGPRDDERVKTFRRFLLRYRYLKNEETRPGRDRVLFQEFPALYYAYELHTSPMYKRLANCLQARLLARQSNEEIATQLATLPDTVDWYESMFYHVRDRFEAHDWIVQQILVPAHARMLGDNYTEAMWDMSLKFFGYFGGPLMVDFATAGFNRGAVPQSRDEIGGYLDQQYSLAVKHRSTSLASFFEVNKYQILQLFELHAKLIEVERSEEAAEQLRTGFEKNLQGMIGEFPWAVGEDGQLRDAKGPLGQYDHSHAELRDQELLRMGAGEPLPELEPLLTAKYPAPPPPQETVTTEELFS